MTLNANKRFPCKCDLAKNVYISDIIASTVCHEHLMDERSLKSKRFNTTKITCFIVIVSDGCAKFE